MPTPKRILNAHGYVQDELGHLFLGLGVLVGENGTMPEYAHDTDSGFDLRSAEDLTLAPGDIRAVSTDLQFRIPPNHEIQVRPRSGLALNWGVTVLNSPGTVDEGYTGVVKVILFNAGKLPFTICRGDRIAQGVVAPVVRPQLVQVDTMPATDRGTHGFGSTGMK